VDRSVRFYEEWCDLTLLHRRTEPKRDGSGERRVAWMGPRPRDGRPAEFWIVLFEVGRSTGPTSLFDHLGFDLESREAVDRIADRAKAAGIIHWPAKNRGLVAGYLCGIRDPDGNVVEFSCGQTIEKARAAEDQDVRPEESAPLDRSS
jgi:catechol 2,3-dioxygenase-like lactoylglutathione lyase family enzyme